MIRYYKLGDHSVFVVLIVLEGLQEVVVLCEGLVSACLGHVESSVFHLLPPESDCLLPLVPHACVDELLQLLVTADLPPLLEAEGLPEVIVHILRRDCDSTLVVHDQSADSILIQGLGGECSFIGGLI